MGGGLVGPPALSGNFLPPTALARSSPLVMATMMLMMRVRRMMMRMRMRGIGEERRAELRNEKADEEV